MSALASAVGPLFFLGPSRWLHLAPSVLVTLGRYRQLRPTDTEAAGLLLGRLLHGNTVLSIEAVTEPAPLDRRTRFACELRDPAHQVAAEQLRSATQGAMCVWGDWHTHAEPVPTPSPLDEATWRAWAADDKNGFLYFIIVGTQQSGLWQVTHGREMLGWPIEQGA